MTYAEFPTQGSTVLSSLYYSFVRLLCPKWHFQKIKDKFCKCLSTTWQRRHKDGDTGFGLIASFFLTCKERVSENLLHVLQGGFTDVQLIYEYWSYYNGLLLQILSLSEFFMSDDGKCDTTYYRLYVPNWNHRKQVEHRWSRWLVNLFRSFGNSYYNPTASENPHSTVILTLWGWNRPKAFNRVQPMTFITPLLTQVNRLVRRSCPKYSYYLVRFNL